MGRLSTDGKTAFQLFSNRGWTEAHLHDAWIES